jgi:hypothetical protein
VVPDPVEERLAAGWAAICGWGLRRDTKIEKGEIPMLQASIGGDGFGDGPEKPAVDPAFTGDRTTGSGKEDFRP